MALARLALRNLQHKLSTTATTGSASASSSALLGRLNNACDRSAVVQRPSTTWSHDFMKNRFMATSSATSSDQDASSKQVAVSDGDSKPKGLFKKKKAKRGGGLFNWRKRRDQDVVPALWEYFPSGLGNALLEASENINKLFQSMNISPYQLIGRAKEETDCYKLRYEVPGLSKEDLKITVDDGVLTITGDHEEEKEEENSDDESYWSSKMYGYYNTSVMLPDDAKVDEIKAELKNGVLNIVIPRTEQPKKDVKEVKIH